MTLQQKVKAIIADSLGVDVSSISRSDSIFDDLGADELDFVELIMAIEEEFGIEIPDDDTQALLTVGAIVDYIKSGGVATGFPDAEEDTPKTIGGLEVEFVSIDE